MQEHSGVPTATGKVEAAMRRYVRAAIVVLVVLGGFAQSQRGQEPSTGPKPEVGETTLAPRKAQLASAQPEKNVLASDRDVPWQTILAAKTVAVIGMDEYGKRCAKPPFPCGKRAKKPTEMSLRKWGRFTLLKDPREADLVVVAMESTYLGSDEDQTWAQLRVFKGPLTPALLATLQKKLAAQLGVYTGPVALEKDPELLWEGWRSNGSPEAKNPPASLRPSFLEGLLSTLSQVMIEIAEEKARDRRNKELEKCSKQKKGCDPELVREVYGDAVRATMGAGSAIQKLRLFLEKRLEKMVADDFMNAVAEAEKGSSMATPPDTQPPGAALTSPSQQPATQPGESPTPREP